MIPVSVTFVEGTEWASKVSELVKGKSRAYGHLTVRRTEDGARRLEVLLLDRKGGAAEILWTPILDGENQFPSITDLVPAAHWAERAVGDLWGLHATGHPRWKSLILHEAWPKGAAPYGAPQDGTPWPRETHFMKVGGEGVHEIPVGPIHAGIIEPGHFRFSCLGEVVANLEIRLGYQHRGVEARLAQVPWRHARHVAESASPDTTAANALAHSEAIESLFGFQQPGRAAALRTVALEIERLANHLGDLGALASDVGFALGAGGFGRLRGAALCLGLELAGSRFQRGFICPGGVAWDVSARQVKSLQSQVAELKPLVEELCKLLFRNPGIQERMDGVGILQPSLAAEFGMVGPSSRASAGSYDARRHFAHGLYPGIEFKVVTEPAGDAFARAKVRRCEIFSSLKIVETVLESLPAGVSYEELAEHLPSDRVGVAVVEAWRGELIHWVTTDSRGEISRYVIRDPSFQNWTGLAIAARHNLVADFPLINKSFNLSYSGNDL